MNSTGTAKPFEPYRSIGTFIDGPAHHTYSIDKKPYFVCSTGTSYKVYSLPDLKIKLLSPSLPTPVQALAAYNEFIFAASESSVYKLHFQHLVERRVFESPITAMLIAGKLLFVGLADRTLHVLESADLRHSRPLALGFAPRTLMHPAGYLNKLLAADEGSLALYNVNNGQLLYNFQDDPGVFGLLKAERLVLLEDSPAPDVAALGFRSGLLVGLNLRTCARVFEFRQSHELTAVAFTRDPQQPPRLLSASAAGEIFVWNLARKAMEARITTAFSFGVGVLSLLRFKDQELLLAASPAQNSVKVLRFDEQSVERFVPLRARQGLVYPLEKLRFYNGRFLVGLSGRGHGELIRFSLFNDAASQLLSTRVSRSQGRNAQVQTELTRKTDDVVDFAFSELKINLANNHNLFSKHVDSPFPLFWDLEAVALRPVFLELQSDYKAAFSARYADRMRRFRTVTALEVSNCGNFLFVGFSDGVLLKLATQSGRLVTDFADELSARTELPVAALHSDLKDHYLIARGRDAIFKFDFFKGALLQEKPLFSAGCYLSAFDRKSELLMVCFDQGALELLAGATLQVVRRFALGPARVLDLCFFAADKKAVLACADGALLVVDLFLGEVLSRYRFERPVVSLCFDERAGFLATAFEGQRDVCLWKVNNIHLKSEQVFEGGFVSELREFPVRPRLAYFSEAPSTTSSSRFKAAGGKDTLEELRREIRVASASWLAERAPPSTASHRPSFSAVPISKWKALLDLEAILANNELAQRQFQEAEPEELPFFLDFGESPLDRINAETLGSLAPAPKIATRRQTKDVDANALIDELGDPIQKALAHFGSEGLLTDQASKAGDALLRELKGLSAVELDYLLKKNLISVENAALKLCLFFAHCLKDKSDWDFKHALLKHFLTVSLSDSLR